MFPRDRLTEENLQSLLPPSLPRLRSDPSGFERTPCFEDFRRSGTRIGLLSRSQRRSSVPHAMLPGVASLISSTNQDGVIDFTSPERRQHRSELRSPTQARPQVSSIVSTALLSSSVGITSQRDVPPWGLAAFASPPSVESGRFDASLSNRSTRWTPYAMASARTALQEPVGLAMSAWDDTDIAFHFEGTRINHRRRRTSPRRRLAASKARPQAMHMMVDTSADRTGLRGRSLTDQSWVERAAFAPRSSVSSIRFSPSSTAVLQLDSSPSKKNSRYLREIDRRIILARLDRGEKQSALAKEFQVTRAAICNLNKHRDLVLARQNEDPLAKHPKKTRLKQETGSGVDTEEVEPEPTTDTVVGAATTRRENIYQSPVQLVALLSAERLMPLLLSSETTDTAFRRYCDRLMTLVVEEALAWSHSKAHACASKTFTSSCGVAVAPGGYPMLSIFQELEPELPTGCITISANQCPSAVLELPPVVESHNVCLFYAFTDAAGAMRVAKSIQELLDRGAEEELLCLVTLAVSELTIDELQRAHPSLKIAAAHVESEDVIDQMVRGGDVVDGDSTSTNSRLRMLASRLARMC